MIQTKEIKELNESEYFNIVSDFQPMYSLDMGPVLVSRGVHKTLGEIVLINSTESGHALIQC